MKTEKGEITSPVVYEQQCLPASRAFFHWLVRRELIARKPFDRVTFSMVGKPLIQTFDADEFERLLLACNPTP